jgi:hypothetical protein
MTLFLAMGAGLVALYLIVQAVRPLLERGVVTAEDWARVEDESAALLTRRDRLIAELREIEFEAAMHKIDARDLEALRARYEAEALEVVRQLDERAQGYAERIEAEVDGVAGKKTPPRGEEVAPQAAPEPAAEDSSGCAACGTTNDDDARFCKGCGASLAGPEPVSESA